MMSHNRPLGSLRPFGILCALQTFFMPRKDKRPEHHRPDLKPAPATALPRAQINPTDATKQMNAASATASAPATSSFTSTTQSRPSESSRSIRDSPSVVEIPKPTNWDSSPSFMEIARPTNLPGSYVPAAAKPMFSTATFRPGAPPQPSFHSRISRDEDDEFNPDAALGDDRFGFDPSMYMDAENANENIKALLEGAFDDEDGKPRTRLRKKKVEEESAADLLGRQMKQLNVESQHAKAATQEVEEEEDDGSVEGLSVRLLPHQIDGLAWMIDKESGPRKKNGGATKRWHFGRRHGSRQDDSSLVSHIEQSEARWRYRFRRMIRSRKIPKLTADSTLVVAPLALIKQWESEVKDKIEKRRRFRVLVHHGSSRTKHADELEKYDIVVTTYHTLISEHESSTETKKAGVFGVQWYRVILDEAHTIKNRNAKMTKAAYNLESVYRWCLTGTPMQNNLDELQSLIRFLRIKPYWDLRVWKDQITGPMSKGRGGLAMKRLQYFLKAFMKRRTKDILKEDGAFKLRKSRGTVRTDFFFQDCRTKCADNRGTFEYPRTQVLRGTGIENRKENAGNDE